MSDSQMVSVPRELLAEVLNTAESDSCSTQAEFSCRSAEDEIYESERKRIRELRKMAGIEDAAVSGRGFFGAAIAAGEQTGA